MGTISHFCTARMASAVIGRAVTSRLVADASVVVQRVHQPPQAGGARVTLTATRGRQYRSAVVMAGEVSKPHDHLFRSVFREETEAAGLLRAHLPEAVNSELRWSSLKRQEGSFIDDRLRDSESDLLYAVQRKADDASAWLYVLLEHQSTPDPWLRLRLLKYSIRIWERDRKQYADEQHLRPIVPLVLYQGPHGWSPAREFSELFAPAVRGWPGVPRYAHLLVDQTKVGPDELRGELRGRIAQLALMAAYRASWPVMQRLVPLLAELVQDGGTDELRQIVVYMAATTREPERWDRFADAVRRHVPGGGELMNKTQEMLEIYGEVVQQEARQEGRQEGVLMTQVRTIEGLLGRDVPWATIEAATGIDEAAFGRLKQQLEASSST